MGKNELLPEIKRIYDHARQELTFLVEQNISPRIEGRCSTLSSHPVATILAHTALGRTSERAHRWIEQHARGLPLTEVHTTFSGSSSLMFACFEILEDVCDFPIRAQVQEKMPSLDEIEKQLDYSCSYDDCYTLPLHLACAALFCTIKGEKMPQILRMLGDLQQEDGSWTDDTTITALSAIALREEGIEPAHNVQEWLKREQLPDGSWAAANGEVWEASYALRTRETALQWRLVETLKECMHPNCWWGFSRFAVPDIDDTAMACYALAPYEPRLASTACKNLGALQHENGGWGAFPQITGVVPRESVVRRARTSDNDVTCHVLEALEQNKMCGPGFEKGISYLLEAQEKDGHWTTTWWNSNIYATVEIALLLGRNGYLDPAFHALEWLENQLEGELNIVECTLLARAFSEYSDFVECRNRALDRFLAQCHSASFGPTFDGVHFVGLIDYGIHRRALIVSAFRSLLKRSWD
ncbi:MAG: hypothetical protein HXS52_03300 [Theionarchaea archaeon]|nr:hypothetical protein [Theionarchaea archaeon]